MRAAKSCQQIARIGDSTGDGEYWIDPERNGNPFRAFCDMTTDGGEFHFPDNRISLATDPKTCILETSFHQDFFRNDREQKKIRKDA